ncbi:hypothetical protein [Chitinophaga sp. YR627]|uniref:hypothetical protein n=1 Tax=Chitinophaga sp. YR627 TaxID=1881041 RepID=UPI000B7F968D|nr:hypothetical protein [Chitinophaga sp. YR627]
MNIRSFLTKTSAVVLAVVFVTAGAYAQEPYKHDSTKVHRKVQKEEKKANREIEKADKKMDKTEKKIDKGAKKMEKQRRDSMR